MSGPKGLSAEQIRFLQMQQMQQSQNDKGNITKRREAIRDWFSDSKTSGRAKDNVTRTIDPMQAAYQQPTKKNK